MNYTIRLFAGLAEALNESELQLHSEHPLTTDALKTLLAEQYTHAADKIERSLVAVNKAYAGPGVSLNETDEIALIPPVGGGSGELWESCRIVDEPLDVAAAYHALEDVRNGGVVLFMGTVREWTGTRQTLYLNYEAYESMAIQQMQRIEAEVRSEYPDVTTLQWHRVGHLNPMDIAVICGAASPHRDAAFAAARALIERLKAEVPIWKKEFYADGEVTWRENP